MRQPLAIRSQRVRGFPSLRIKTWGTRPPATETGIAAGGEVCACRSDGFVKGFGKRCENGCVLGEKWRKWADFGLKMRLFGALCLRLKYRSSDLALRMRIS